MTTDIRFSREQHVGFITLERVQALNALTLPMIKALQKGLLEWENDVDVHVIVIQAAPGKAFCAGGDVRGLAQAAYAEQMQFFWHEYHLNQFIHQLTTPYVALMDGITMGGGVGISLHGSHPVASERFMFAMPETSIGFFPDIGACHLLSRCPRQFGPYLGLTGARLTAVDAKALGLVKHVVSSESIPLILASLLEADLSMEAPARVDALLQRFTNPIHTPSILEDCGASVEASFGFETMEAIMASLAKTDEAWHQSTLDGLLQKSPLSLLVTLTQLQKAKTMTLAECLAMDYGLAAHFMRDHDFYEGIRALLVDKDKSPQWQPASLSAVSAQTIDHYFECEKQGLFE